MAIFNDLDINFRLDNLEVQEHSDRWAGVEPYVIPVFFKIDGDKYKATLHVANNDSSDSLITFDLKSQPAEHDPVIFTPPGPLLSGNEQLEDGDQLDLTNIAFATTLKPIPLDLDIAGVIGLDDILEKLSAPVIAEVIDGVVVDLLNVGFNGISDLLGAALGLDETLESCPDLDVDVAEFLNTVDVVLKTLIPGTVGGVFAAMENDAFDEDDVATVQTTLRSEIVDVINELTDTVTLENPVPDEDAATVDQDALQWRIIGDLFFRFDPLFWWVMTAWILYATPDDFIGYHIQTFDHTSIDVDSDNIFAKELEGDDNRWRLQGSLTVS
jgi:hypothetical protein